MEWLDFKLRQQATLVKVGIEHIRNYYRTMTQTANPNPMSKRPSGKSARGSNTKPIAILVLGVFSAIALAAFLSRSTAEEGPKSELILGTSDSLTTSDLRVKGPEDAVVTLMEFGDFQCPACGVFHPVVSELMNRFPNQLKLEFHHYPLISVHPNALAAAIASEAAAEQDAFWEMYDLLFELQSQWADHSSAAEVFTIYAERLELDPELFETAYRSGGPEARVLADTQRAQQMQLPGTPTFFIDDKMIPLPRSFDEFENAISSAIEDAVATENAE